MGFETLHCSRLLGEHLASSRLPGNADGHSQQQGPSLSSSINTINHSALKRGSFYKAICPQASQQLSHSLWLSLLPRTRSPSVGPKHPGLPQPLPNPMTSCLLATPFSWRLSQPCVLLSNTFFLSGPHHPRGYSPSSVRGSFRSQA